MPRQPATQWAETRPCLQNASSLRHGEDQQAIVWRVASNFLAVVGPQLYAGPENSPTLLTGDFTVYDAYDHYDPDVAVAPPLRLSVSVAVPEPATWGMMIVGFGAIGSSLRHRRKPAVAHA